MRCFPVVIFSVLGVLAGCAAPPTPVASNQPVGYTGEVVAVRQVTEGQLTTQITKILGQADYSPQRTGQEVVVRLSDGEVKSFVPPSGVVPAGLAPGAHVLITETPTMKISLR